MPDKENAAQGVSPEKQNQGEVFRCHRCGQLYPCREMWDPDLCQECWEAECDDAWWRAVSQDGKGIEDMTEDKRKVIRWLSGDDAGLSSERLAYEFLGETYHNFGPPLDPDDLGRCLRLIAAVPAVRRCVDSLGDRDLQWARAAACWDEIAASMEQEVGIGWEKGNSAPRTYRLMKRRGL